MILTVSVIAHNCVHLIVMYTLVYMPNINVPKVMEGYEWYTLFSLYVVTVE